jgi:hypothetical protein
LVLRGTIEALWELIKVLRGTIGAPSGPLGGPIEAHREGPRKGRKKEIKGSSSSYGAPFC